MGIFSDAIVLILSESEFHNFAASYLIDTSLLLVFLDSGKVSVFFPLNKYLEFQRVNSSFRYLGYVETNKLLKNNNKHIMYFSIVAEPVR